MRFVLLLSLLALAACDTLNVAPPPPAEVRAGEGLVFTTDRDTYRRGQTAQLELHNARQDTLMTGVVECAQLEVWDGSVWGPAREREGRVCIALGVYLTPGRTLRGAVPLRVPAGTYRATHSLVPTGGPEAEERETVIAVTPPFRVR